MKKGSTPTMKDVAREAGVALGTVSRVFNGLSVGDEYRIKVEEAAHRLGYQVNPYARGLKTNKTNIIAVLLPSMTHPYYAELAHSIYFELAKKDYHMMLFLTEFDLEKEDACIQMVRQNKVDGIIGLTYNPVVIHPDIPFISIDRLFRSNVPCVASDNYGGGRMAAEHFASTGCKKVLFARTGSPIPSEADKRGDGFLTGCSLLNLPCDSLKLLEPEPDFFVDYFRQHMQDGKLEYDGIFCSTDRLAIELNQILNKLNIRVPEDVQLIGFDGIRRFDTDDYYCSTFVQPVGQIAETAVELLLRPDRSNIPSLICLPVRYAYGGTTKIQEESQS